MKSVFWGSSDYSMPALKALYQSSELMAVVTQPDKPIGRGMKNIHKTPVKLFAEEKDIPVFQPNSLKSESIVNELKQLNADIFVVVSYGKILPDEYLNMCRYGAINLHASLLPKYRGASPVQAAILNGDSFTGNTIQKINRRLDSGDIYMQSRVEIGEHETAPELFEKLAEDGAELLKRALKAIENNEISPIKQDEDQVVYCSIIKKGDGEINFKENSAIQIYNKYRAYIPWPGIFTDYFDRQKREKIHISFTRITYERDINEKPGTIIRADKKGLIIACMEGAINVLSLKPSGKREMDYKSFINGYKPEVGKSFSEE